MLQKFSADQKVDIIQKTDINRNIPQLMSKVFNILFVLKKGLIYYVNNEKRLKLYISPSIK